MQFTVSVSQKFVCIDGKDRQVGTYFHKIKLDFEQIGQLCSVTIRQVYVIKCVIQEMPSYTELKEIVWVRQN